MPPHHAPHAPPLTLLCIPAFSAGITDLEWMKNPRHRPQGRVSAGVMSPIPSSSSKSRDDRPPRPAAGSSRAPRRSRRESDADPLPTPRPPSPPCGRRWRSPSGSGLRPGFEGTRRRPGRFSRSSSRYGARELRFDSSRILEGRRRGSRASSLASLASLARPPWRCRPTPSAEGRAPKR